jgi:hypothetical protein
MLALRFEPTAYALERGVSGYSLGDLTIAGDRGTVTSAGRTPNQSLMIYVAVPIMLHELTEFLRDPGKTRWEFVSVDSSFSWEAKKRPGGRLAMSAYDQPLAEVTPAELVQAVWQGVTDLLAQHPLPPSDPAYDDLAGSLADFRRAFAL